MDFFLVGFIYWILIAASLFLLFLGLWKKSWKELFVSGIALLIPSLTLYIGGAEGWFRLSGLGPILLFVLAFYIKSKKN